MKKLFGAFLALFASVAFATTLVPVQLLNPTGSSSGQAIVSTGSSSAPAWGAVSAASLASQAANTVVANFTASSASPTAFSMPSCTGAANALGYTSGTGIVCNSAINAATLGGQSFTSSPTITTPVITGVTSGATGSTGQVGQFLNGSASGTSMTSGTPANCASMTLPAGNWLIWGTVFFNPAGSTTVSSLSVGANTTSATLPSPDAIINATLTTGTAQQLVAPPTVKSTTSSGTAYMVGQATFGTSTMTCNAFIYAIRFN